MKALLVALFAVVAFADPKWEQFNQFMLDYGKVYPSLDETTYRFHVFQRTLATIERLNAENIALGGGAAHGVNGMADLTVEEFHQRLMKNLPYRAPDLTPIEPVNATAGMVDWRTKGAITPVKDQGQCGSCWAHSADEAQESFEFIAHGGLKELSQQQCTACTYNYNGCNGGWPHDAYVQAIENRNGIELNADYPYNIAQAGNCKFGANGKATTPVSNDKGTGFFNVARGQLQTSLDSTGPLSVCVAAESWQTYTSGVLKSCPGSVDHCVQAVGYNIPTSGESYWIVRNSWGTGWGQKGYIYLDLSTDNGDICHIQEYMTYPNIA